MERLDDDQSVGESAIVARRCFEARKHVLGLSQSELARLLGLEATTISRWERGISEPTAVNLRAYARLAEKPISWFYEEAVAA